ncbi:MAG: triose-phosphate isomerase [Candidatus Tyrphobacter sp.]
MSALVVGNWKMNETAREATALARGICERLGASPPSHVRVVMAPPFTALAAVGEAIAGTPIALGAQDLFWKDAGAFTGAISAPMLVDLGVRYVIVGHSERRRYFGESDDDVRRKTRAALAHGLQPVVAVGETSEERDAGITDERVRTQVRAAIDAIAPGDLRRIAIAYEPVWAIGTGRSCEPAEADRVMRLIRVCAGGLEDLPVLYGGSVTPANFPSYLAFDGCSGGLIGGASLDAQAFASIVRAASER